jgi:hypothetical protein
MRGEVGAPFCNEGEGAGLLRCPRKTEPRRGWELVILLVFVSRAGPFALLSCPRKTEPRRGWKLVILLVFVSRAGPFALRGESYPIEGLGVVGVLGSFVRFFVWCEGIGG